MLITNSCWIYDIIS